MNQCARSRALFQILGLLVGLCPIWAAAQQVYRLTDIGLVDGADDMHGGRINESGQVAGVATSDGGIEYAYLWDGSALIDLGTLGGSGSAVHAINNAGQVTGRSRTAEDLEEHAFLWDGDSMQDLGTLGGEDSEGSDINDSGQVTGNSDISGSTTRHAFLWDGEDLLDLGTLGGTSSRSHAINAAGQVTGYAQTAGGAEHAFRWSGGVMQDLGTLGGTSSRGEAINPAGQVTGNAQTTGNASRHAFLWSGGAMQDLGSIEVDSFGLAIDNSGQVVGVSYEEPPPGPVVSSHAFLWDGNAMQDLGAPGWSFTGAGRINSSGQVLGNGQLAGDEDWHPIVWINGTLHELNGLIDPADPLKPHVTLTGAEDINDRGQIVATGVDSRTSGQRVYVVSPVAADVFLGLASLTDVNGNGTPDVATLVAGLESGSTVYVMDGGSGDSIAEITILDDDWRAIDLAVTPGGAGSVVAVLAQKDDGAIAVAVHRARNGVLVREIPYFGRRSVPSALANVPNATGPGNSAFAVIAKNIDDQRVSVQLRKRSDGSLINTNRFFLTGWDAIELDTIGDISGNGRPELVVLARSEAGLNQVVVKDAETRAKVNKINYFGASTTPKSAVVLGDIGGAAAPELTVLGELPDGRYSAQNRDALTDERVSSVSFFNSSWSTIGIESLADVNGNGSADLAVLAQHDTNHAIKAQVRDASTGDLLRTVNFLGATWSARAFAAFADIDGNGVQEIGVAARQEDGAIRVQLRDAATGSLVRTIDIP